MRMFLPFGLALISFNAYTAECGNTKYESEMYECFKEKLNEQDKLLNQTYNKLLNTYKSDGPLVLSNAPSKDVYLKKAQLAWIKPGIPVATTRLMNQMVELVFLLFMKNVY